MIAPFVLVVVAFVAMFGFLVWVEAEPAARRPRVAFWTAFALWLLGFGWLMTVVQ